MIREMLVSDIDEVMEIEEVSFSDAWNYDHFVYEILFNPYASIWVLENEESEIVGFADLWIMFERAEIANIAIRKDQQGRGLGYKLMQHIEKLAIEAHCETIALEVRVSNKSAISLYKKCGFEIINTKKNYYYWKGVSEDGHFMMKGI
ncbi:MAG TPA: ribosomal protein S18-alanine N-acetyltransferase [Erysipelotrichaceae bacterium]|nr:ribosomal protein S18-alanine N-acetyltransferase [Erysipelotrichaceae bacterium]HQB32589.1 ribosomal protein S18-alanine N-acetyltransferase [Erysipelotrichaceae bacterium]